APSANPDWLPNHMYHIAIPKSIGSRFQALHGWRPQTFLSIEEDTAQSIFRRAWTHWRLISWDQHGYGKGKPSNVILQDSTHRGYHGGTLIHPVNYSTTPNRPQLVPRVVRSLL